MPSPYGDLTTPDAFASEVGGGVDPAEEALLQTLAQIRAVQAKPLLPDGGLPRFGVALSGIANAVMGKPEPMLRNALLGQQAQLAGLKEQAAVEQMLGQIQAQRTLTAYRQRMEVRQQERDEAAALRSDRTERFKIESEVHKGVLERAKDNPLYEPLAMQLAEGMYRRANIPLPPGGFTLAGMRDAGRQAPNILRTLLMSPPGTPDEEIAKSLGVDPSAVAQVRGVHESTGPERALNFKALFNIDVHAIEKGDVELTAAKLALDKSKVEGQVATRLYRLDQKAAAGETLSPGEDAERLTLKNFGKASSDETEMAITLMRTKRLPLDLAFAQAKRTLAEAAKQPKEPSDFDTVVQAFQAKNPNLSKADAILSANAQQKASRQDFSQLEEKMDTMRDFVDRLEEYSKAINVSGSGIGAKTRGLIRYGASWVTTDVALAGLQRKRAELANVMRTLGGEKGTISDRDIARGELLLPTVFTSGPIAEDSIKELRRILQRGEANLAKRRTTATTVPSNVGPGNPDDPYGLRR